MLLPETMVLHRRLRAGHRDLPNVALAAGVLATVREHLPGPRVARQVGPADPEKPETALLKPLRFRRLMEAETPDERLLAFRRLVALADRSVNVHDLAAAMLHWTEERRQRWAYDYWNAGDPPATA
jgi:CRISPR system Cascade subunit CasB